MRERKVAIVMGSDSDLEVISETVKVLEEFHVQWEIMVSSAHRSPQRTTLFAREAEKKGVGVIIAGAGGAAHLAGILAAETILPVIGIPVASSPLNGLDALLSTVQMPSGIPVATMAIGKAGARNAALMAIQIFAMNDDALTAQLREYRAEMARSVETKDRKVKEKLFSRIKE